MSDLVSMGQVGLALVAALFVGMGYLWIKFRYDFFRSFMFSRWFRYFLLTFIGVVVLEWYINNNSHWLK